MTRRGLSRRRGSTLVEFVMIAMLLVLLVFAGFEFSRMALVYTAIANAAKAGVRYAIVHGANRSGGSGADGASGGLGSDEVVTVVKKFASSGALNSSGVTVLVTYPASAGTNPGNSIGSTVIVKVSYVYDPFVSLLPLRVPLSSEARGIIVF